MPLWLKVILVLLVVGVVVVVFTGVTVVKMFKAGAAAGEQAGAEGKGFGFNNSLDACVEAGVRRAELCKAKQVGCAMTTHSFLWGCAEAADYDAEFCEKVPAPGQDTATLRWSRQACATYGSSENQACDIALQVIPSFCSYRRQTG